MTLDEASTPPTSRRRSAASRGPLMKVAQLHSAHPRGVAARIVKDTDADGRPMRLDGAGVRATRMKRSWARLAASASPDFEKPRPPRRRSGQGPSRPPRSTDGAELAVKRNIRMQSAARRPTSSSSCSRYTKRTTARSRPARPSEIAARRREELDTASSAPHGDIYRNARRRDVDQCAGGEP